MSYRGFTAPIPLGRYGLVGTSRIIKVPVGALIEARNIKYSRGTVDRTGGSVKYTSGDLSGVPSVLGLLDWWPTTAAQRVLAYTNAGAILRDDGDGTFPTSMKTGLNVGVPFWLCAGQEALGNVRIALFTDGIDVVQVVSGDAATTANIASTKPSDWSGTNQPKFFVLHNNRVWGGLGHRMYFSTIDNHCDFQGAGSGTVPIYPGRSKYLQGGISWNGRLWLWKYPKGLYWIDDSSTDVTAWICHEHSPNVGLAGPNAQAVGDNDVYFLSEVGHVMRLSGIQEWGDVGKADLTALNDLTEWTRENVNLTADALATAEARYYSESKEVHFAVRGIGSSTKNLRIIVDLNLDVPRIRVEDKDICQALALWTDGNGIERLLAGDASGNVWKLDQDTLSIGGLGYTAQFQTPHDDFSWLDGKLETLDKNFAFLEVVMRPVGNYDLSVDVWIDGDYSHTVTFNMGGSGAALDAFVLDTDRLAGDVVKNLRKRLKGSGRRLSLVGRVYDAGSDFRLSELLVSFGAGAE